MHIAILGATSQIAKDLILAFAKSGEHSPVLFARRPEAVEHWKAAQGVAGFPARDLSSFAITDERFDAVINFVGVANPVATASLGAEIMAVTAAIDDIAMAYVSREPHCRYMFLSSGAAYCSAFDEPAQEGTVSKIALNRLGPQDWYGLAKLQAECRHRASSHLPIVDLRLFSYFSRTHDMAARFLVTDAVRAIRDGTSLRTSPADNVRDYLHPTDFHRLVERVLASGPANTALDCHTREPSTKWELLDALRDSFGLRYEVAGADAAVNSTGAKPNYYSLDRRAAAFGYTPSLGSLEGVLLETQAHLAGQ